MNEENKPFTYTYCADEQAEIKKIRDKYKNPEDKGIDKMEQLRRLDAGVTRKANTVSLILGVLGSMILGSGMSLVMTDIGESLGLAYSMWIGIAVGVVGIVLAALAYPVYDRITKKERERIAPEIIRLTDELMK